MIWSNMKVGRSREVGNFVYQITRQPVFEIFTGRQCDYETMYCFIYDKLLIKKKYSVYVTIIGEEKYVAFAALLK